ESGVDSPLSGFFVLEINDRRVGDAALLEETNQRIVAAVLHREGAEHVRIFPAQDADDEDPGFVRLPAEVFSCNDPRTQLKDQKDEQQARDRSSHIRRKCKVWGAHAASLQWPAALPGHSFRTTPARRGKSAENGIRECAFDGGRLSRVERGRAAVCGGVNGDWC